jgi:hypothetical protein
MKIRGETSGTEDGRQSITGASRRKYYCLLSSGCRGPEGPRNNKAGAVMNGGLTATWYQDLRASGRRVHFLPPGTPVFTGFPGYSGWFWKIGWW